MSSLSKTASWVIVNKETGKAECETYCEKTAIALTIYSDELTRVPILEWLQHVNRKAKAQQNAE
jgi:hypothetical protein